MEFQYTDKTKEMFKEIRQRTSKFLDFRDTYCETMISGMVKEIKKEYDRFLVRELEKRGYTIEELKSGRHKLNEIIKPIGVGIELHQYFVDGDCVLEVLNEANLIFDY